MSQQKSTDPQQWAPGQRLVAPSHASFIARFGDAFPEPVLLQHHLGRVALYELKSATVTSTPVVIVHGINTPALGMLRLAREVQRRKVEAHIVMFDLWGHGMSDTPAQAHTPEVFCSQIELVLSHMQWQRAHFIGFSFGASTVVSLMVINPERVLSAALLAPAGLLRIGPEIEAMLEGDVRSVEVVDAIFDYLGAKPAPVDSPAPLAGQALASALQEWELAEHPGYRRSVLSMFRDGGVRGRKEYFAQAARGRTKVSVVLAELDDVCSPSELTTLGFMDIVVVQGVGHAFVRTVPAQVADALDRFLMAM